MIIIETIHSSLCQKLQEKFRRSTLWFPTMVVAKKVKKIFLISVIELTIVILVTGDRLVTCLDLRPGSTVCLAPHHNCQVNSSSCFSIFSIIICSVWLSGLWFTFWEFAISNHTHVQYSGYFAKHTNFQDAVNRVAIRNCFRETWLQRFKTQ